MSHIPRSVFLFAKRVQVGKVFFIYNILPCLSEMALTQHTPLLTCTQSFPGIFPSLVFLRPSFSIIVLFAQSYILIIRVLAFRDGHGIERDGLLFNFLLFLRLSVAERAVANV